jgi:hypothetical protein
MPSFERFLCFTGLLLARERTDIRFGSEAEALLADANVRFRSESRH